MSITLHDIKPIGLCIATQDLFDTKKFILNYCDNTLLRGKDVSLANKINIIKRDLNSIRTQPKFLDGFKAVLISNIDKIIALVESRYAKTFSEDVELVKKSGKNIIEKIMNAQSFEEIAALEDVFKTNIVHPTYRLFTEDMKKFKINIV
ncbi:MAG: hypothetical protein N3E38_01140 [Candidatus Aenigmarchaeota archaeon]|nr:hypothetical protein [Candidatus Aenigmarchaeota archaeon]MCX8179327.1 hypothetical protein [Candidatus Aenigmarchaeota archaeon]